MMTLHELTAEKSLPLLVHLARLSQMREALR